MLFCFFLSFFLFVCVCEYEHVLSTVHIVSQRLAFRNWSPPFFLVSETGSLLCFVSLHVNARLAGARTLWVSLLSPTLISCRTVGISDARYGFYVGLGDQF